MRSRLLTWPLAGFLLGFGSPLNDPTIRSVSDVLLASALISVFPLLIGLIFAAVFRKGDAPLKPGSARAIPLAVTSTVILKILLPGSGLGLVAAGLFTWWLRRSPK